MLPEYRLSRAADADLKYIARYTFNTWGEDQTRRYIDDLRSCIEKLTVSPMMGRACDHIRPGFRRMEQGKHVILYRPEGNGVFISRILHQRMLPGKHILEGS